MIKNLLINFAYFLSSSPSYLGTKAVIKDALTDSSNKFNRYITALIIFFIISSVYILIMDVNYTLPSWMLFYDLYIVTVIFLIEYLLRLWVYSDIHKIIIKQHEDSDFLNKKHYFTHTLWIILKDKWRYISSPLAIIDLLAILPAYRPLRILRIFILFRIFKVLRYTKNINQFFEVIRSKKLEFYTLGVLLSFVVFTGGVTIYVFESDVNEDIHNLFDGMYWALVTISTVGFGDIAPVTNGGKVASMALILSGIGIISFSTSLIVASFNERLDSIRKSRAIDASAQKEYVIICGFGQMSEMLVQTFEHKNISYIVIEKDYQKYQQGLHQNINIINDDATKHQAFKDFELEKAKAILATTSDDVANTYITLNVRSISKEVKIISRCNKDSIGKKLQLAGADFLLKPYNIAGMMTSIYLEEPTSFEAINAILTGKKNAHMEQIAVYKGSFLDGMPIKKRPFEKNKLLLIGVFRDETFIFNPPQDFCLRVGDVVIVLGYIISLDWFKNRLYKNSLQKGV